jgi:hypothetical protein
MDKNSKKSVNLMAPVVAATLVANAAITAKFSFVDWSSKYNNSDFHKNIAEWTVEKCLPIARNGVSGELCNAMPKLYVEPNDQNACYI